MSQALERANRVLFARYLSIITDQCEDSLSDHPRLSLENLKWMCMTAIDQLATMPDDKASRWLGFIQGCLAMRMLIDVDAERDISRPLFHAVATEGGAEIPATLARG